MAQWVKLPLVTPASHIRVWVQVLAALFPIQLPAGVPRKALEVGPSAWPSAVHVGGLYEVPGSQVLA